MSGLTGTGQLLRLAWRRDRIMIPVTLLALFALIYPSVVATLALYPDETSRLAASTAANNSPAVVAMYGTIANPASLEGIGTIKLAMLAFFMVTILAIAIVRRHTRAEEESGRIELLGAGVLGRRAPLAAAVLLAGASSLTAGLLTAVGSGAGGLPWRGSFVLGAAVASTGVAWTGLTAVAAQLSTSNRTVGAFAFGSLGVAFVLRMIGDLNASNWAGGLSWLSPLGWAQQVRPFSENRIWVIALPAALLLACLVGADRLLAARDLGGGLLAERPGAARGRLGTSRRLALRLERGALIGWAAAFAVLGVTFGVLIDTVGAFMTPQAEDMLRQMGGAGAMADLYITLVATVAGFIAACFGVAAVLRMRAEETSLHLEQILATRETRLRFLASHGLIAFLGSAGIVLVLGLLQAATHAVKTGRWSGFWHDLSPMLVQVPALWVVVAIALAVFAWAPRFSSVGWVVLAVFIGLGEFGTLLKFPSWALTLSPYAHTPKVPAEAFRAAPIVGLIAVAAALVAAAVVGFRRRDIVS